MSGRSIGPAAFVLVAASFTLRYHTTMLKKDFHVFFDFDSTIVTKESFDEVIALALSEHPDKAELVKQIEEITNLGMEGTLPFTESLERRLAVTQLYRNDFESVGQNLIAHITPGMPELFAELKQFEVSTFIISGGFLESILPVAQTLGVDESRVFTNQVIANEDGIVTGIDTKNVCYTNEGKAPVIAYIKQSNNLQGSTCMIGDGANDLRAYEQGIADLFCAFTGNVSRAVMKERAPAVATTVPELRDFIFKNLRV